MGEYGRGSGSMRNRIALWAILGAAVVVAWTVYIATTLSNPLGTGGIGRTLVFVTCPISIASRHHPQSLYLVLTANAAVYALFGAVIEGVRRYYSIRSNRTTAQ